MFAINKLIPRARDRNGKPAKGRMRVARTCSGWPDPSECDAGAARRDAPKNVFIDTTAFN